jgi:antitoxin CcdA
MHMLTRTPKTQRKATNLSLDQALVAEAKELEINVSRIAEEAIAAAVRAEKNRRWKDENREAMEAWNEWTRKNGLPLEKYRLF